MYAARQDGCIATNTRIAEICCLEREDTATMVVVDVALSVQGFTHSANLYLYLDGYLTLLRRDRLCTCITHQPRQMQTYTQIAYVRSPALRRPFSRVTQNSLIVISFEGTPIYTFSRKYRSAKG